MTDPETHNQAAYLDGEWHRVRVHEDGGGGLSTACNRAVPPDERTIGAASLVHATTHPRGSGICEQCLLFDKLDTRQETNV